MRKSLTLDDYINGIQNQDRSILARAITLVESSLATHRKLAQELLIKLPPPEIPAIRIGVSGVPGVGKSTFIESFGSFLVERKRKVAVLAVDPSSQLSGGSVLGDKTRMTELARHPLAFVRPSPSAGSLGGVARATRESIQLCEAAGYGTVLVETVGVGQSEAVVSELVDSFLLLLLPGAGDELQGIKRGILELVDLIAINKADGPNKEKANQAQQQYSSALRILRGNQNESHPISIQQCSALKGEGISEIYMACLQHRRRQKACGNFDKRRSDQRWRWLQATLSEELERSLNEHAEAQKLLASLEQAVRAGRMPISSAAEQVLARYQQ